MADINKVYTSSLDNSNSDLPENPLIPTKIGIYCVQRKTDIFMNYVPLNHFLSKHYYGRLKAHITLGFDRKFPKKCVDPESFFRGGPNLTRFFF